MKPHFNEPEKLGDMADAREALWAIICVDLARQITERRRFTRQEVGSGIDKYAKHDCVMGLGLCLTHFAAQALVAQCHRTRSCQRSTMT